MSVSFSPSLSTGSVVPSLPNDLTSEQQERVNHNVAKFLSGEWKQNYYPFNESTGTRTGLVSVYKAVLAELIKLGCEVKTIDNIDNGDSIYGDASRGWLDGVTIEVTALPALATPAEGSVEIPTGLRV